MLAFLNAVPCYVYVCMTAHINRYASQESEERERRGTSMVDGGGVCAHVGIKITTTTNGIAAQAHEQHAKWKETW